MLLWPFLLGLLARLDVLGDLGGQVDDLDLSLRDSGCFSHFHEVRDQEECQIASRRPAIRVRVTGGVRDGDLAVICCKVRISLCTK